MTLLRPLLMVEAVAFAAAASAHVGITVTGFEDGAAGTAESIIGALLLLGWVVASALPRQTWAVAIGVQAFALVGTLIGLTLILRGVGPGTVPDLVFHVGIAVVLLVGLILALVQAGDTRPVRA